MFLKDKNSGHLVEVLNIAMLFDPFKTVVEGRSHFGEEAQDPEEFVKKELEFMSGEDLPRCWLDPHYRDHELRRS